MRNPVFLAVFAILVSRVATADVIRHGSIPESYAGTRIASAGTEPDKSVIVGPEASRSVDMVSQTAGARGSIYSAHLQYFSERGGNKTAANLIIWPQNISRIAVGPEFTSPRIFDRCSATCRTERALSARIGSVVERS
jgi:hypothetical protein